MNSNTRSPQMLCHVSPYLQYVIAINTPPCFFTSPKYFSNRRAAHVPFYSLWRRPSLRSLPTRATGSTLCVMGGRLWFLGDACSSYMCMGSALDVMDYGLAKAKEFSNELIARMLLILRIIALGLTLQRFFNEILANCINMHMSLMTFIHIHK